MPDDADGSAHDGSEQHSNGSADGRARDVVAAAGHPEA
jgi:hypothetical protein